MKNNLISEDVKRMRMIMGYNRSKTLNENFEIISEMTGAGATPPESNSSGSKGTGGGTRTASTVPSELKNVKAFQDWVVSNGFGSELGPTGADSKFGKYTSAAFAKHKNEYLNQASSDSEDDAIVSTSTIINPDMGDEGMIKTKVATNNSSVGMDMGDVNTPATGTPATGTPATGTPATGTPATGTPATGTPATPSAGEDEDDASVTVIPK